MDTILNWFTVYYCENLSYHFLRVTSQHQNDLSMPLSVVEYHLICSEKLNEKEYSRTILYKIYMFEFEFNQKVIYISLSVTTRVTFKPAYE